MSDTEITIRMVFAGMCIVVILIMGNCEGGLAPKDDDE